MDTDSPSPQTEAHEFIYLLVRGGLVLTDLFSDLLEALPDDAFPGEEPGEVLLEMAAGSITPVVAAAGSRTVHEASALIEATIDRILDDLTLAAALAAERE